jgi:ADP-ribosylglycohydrolase
MIGAIAGDVIGSIFEGAAQKSTDFKMFQPYSTYTDDTVMSIAVADAIMNNKEDFQTSLRTWGQKYPKAGYGGRFYGWIFSENPEPYGSWGNGAAMRVSPVGFAYDSEEEVLKKAAESAEITHNSEIGIQGAQANALAVFMARKGADKIAIKEKIEKLFNYDLSRSLDDIRPDYSFEVKADKSVPEAIIAFLESENVEDAIRKAISLGGDSDTQACIAGGIAFAFYKEISEEIRKEVRRRLKPDMIAVLEKFEDQYLSTFHQQA